MKKLFEVEKRYYVMADSEEEAENLTVHGDCSVTAYEAAAVDSAWWDAIPFNADDDRTCGQILTGKEE